MMERVILSGSVEARAFLGGAVKVRYFDTVQEADEWIVGLSAKHAGVTREVTTHRTRLGYSQPRARAAEQEVPTALDEARDGPDPSPSEGFHRYRIDAEGRRHDD